MAKVDPKAFKGERLGRILRRLGRCSREQVYEALHIQRDRKEQLGKLLVELGHCTDDHVTEALSLHSIKTHDWQIQPCCALTGDGISEGLDWIVARVKG